MILRFQSDGDFEQHARLKFPINLIRVKDLDLEICRLERKMRYL